MFGNIDPDDADRSAQAQGQAVAHGDDRGHEDDHNRVDDSDGQGFRLRYRYDDDLRLTGVQGRTRESYTYDPADNLTEADTPSGSTTFTVNGLNQVERAGNTDYTYDADGNLLNNGRDTFRWDAVGRLIEITNKQTGQTSQFTDDGFSRRIGDTETDPSGTPVVTKFLWCGLRICEQRDSSGTVLVRYFPQGELHGSQTLYYAQDQIGSVTAVVDKTGKVIGRFLR